MLQLIADLAVLSPLQLARALTRDALWEDIE
jgi:hypothetical protein